MATENRTIKLRKDSFGRFQSFNPTLQPGEMCIINNSTNFVVNNSDTAKPFTQCTTYYGSDTVSTPPNNGSLTIYDADGAELAVFTADQAESTVLILPAPGDGKVTLEDTYGNIIGSFMMNQANDDTIVIPAGGGGGARVKDSSLLMDAVQNQTAINIDTAFLTQYPDPTDFFCKIPLSPSGIYTNIINLYEGVSQDHVDYTFSFITDDSMEIHGISTMLSDGLFCTNPLVYSGGDQILLLCDGGTAFYDPANPNPPDQIINIAGHTVVHMHFMGKILEINCKQW